jgi:hypothetical protein
MSRNINYDENREIEDDDIGYESPLYEITLFDRKYIITIGKDRKVPEKKNAYYFPVYLVYKHRIKSQIGAFEYESVEKNMKARIEPFLDKERDIDLNRMGDIILYHFVDDLFMKQTHAEVSPIEMNELEYEYQSKKRTKDEKDEKDEIDQYDNDDVLSLKIPKGKESKQITHSDELLKDGFFVLDKNRKLPETLLEETKEDSIKQKKKYSEKGSKKSSTWIERFMKNNDYDIVETLDNGDCLFDTIRLAFSQIGYITTIQKLRAILSNEVTDEIFQTYKNLFLSAEQEKESIDKRMRVISVTVKDLKKRLEKITEKEERKKIIDNIKNITEEYQKIKEELLSTESMISEFKFMRGIENIENLREVIKTTSYWADTWAISTLEKKLNIKLLIFSEEYYLNNDEKSVFQCGQLNDEDLEKQGSYSPNFYIMITYSGNHYRLISYKTKYIFRFSEVPYDVKIQVVIKCMERNAGPYYIIQDFRNFKSRIGIDPDEGFVHDDEPEDKTLDYDKDIVFMYYNRSNPTPKPGKGSNESIPQSKISEYSDLNLKINNDWRKKLDDYWIAEFSLDGMKWSSVEHYYQGAKFKNKRPDFTKLFSLDSGNEISKDVSLAREAGSKPLNKYRPSDIKIDPDFYGGRNLVEREKAVYAKFTQNIDLRNILLATKKAKLLKYISKSPPEIDTIMMRVRSKIQKETK